MTIDERLRCPSCGGGLERDGAEGLACRAGGHAFGDRHGLPDLRVGRSVDVEPAPMRASDFQSAFEAEARGVPYRTALERVLLDLSIVDSDRLMQVLGEGRGAWFPLLSPSPGELLFVGNALSGSIAALAQVGWRVTVLDVAIDRLRFGRYRNEDRYRGRTVSLLAGDGPRLPLADASFDVVLEAASTSCLWEKMVSEHISRNTHTQGLRLLCA
jgi:hypothetical protein